MKTISDYEQQIKELTHDFSVLKDDWYSQNGKIKELEEMLGAATEALEEAKETLDIRFSIELDVISEALEKIKQKE